jgi:hypothetical protein
MAHELKRQWIKLVRAWRRAARTQRNVETARTRAVRSADAELERIAMRGRNWPPG